MLAPDKALPEFLNSLTDYSFLVKHAFLFALLQICFLVLKAQTPFQQFNHDLISHLNNHVVFQTDYGNYCTGEVILLISGRGGKVTEAVLKKGISADVNEQILRVCYDFPVSVPSEDFRFSVMLLVDICHKQILPIL